MHLTLEHSLTWIVDVAPVLVCVDLEASAQDPLISHTTQCSQGNNWPLWKTAAGMAQRTPESLGQCQHQPTHTALSFTVPS